MHKLDMVRTSAPAKIILFGEHAVVYGEPAVAIPINLRVNIEARESDSSRMNNRPLLAGSYIERSLEKVHSRPLAMKIDSDIPSASGLGSSAAITIGALKAALGLKRRKTKAKKLAMLGFEVEYDVQGSASPIDTSTISLEAPIIVKKGYDPNFEFLWKMKKGDKRWFVHRIDCERIDILIGFTGIKSKTREQVQMVRDRIEKRPELKNNI